MASAFETGRGFATGTPRLLLRAEGALVAVAAIVLFRHSGGHWGFFFLLFLAPDLSMLGYLAGPRVGAAVYNGVHSYLVPGTVAALGLAYPAVVPLAATWIAHIGLDRALGYGLKYASGFGDTHLGRKARAAETEATRRQAHSGVAPTEQEVPPSR